MAVQITQGTQTPIFSKLSSGTEIQVVKLDVGAGTAIADFGGTIAAVNSVANGTIAIKTATGVLTGGMSSYGNIGSDAAGLITGAFGYALHGTFAKPIRSNEGVLGFAIHPDAFATVVSTGTNTLGTIKAGVSGSVIYVTDLTISAGSATNVEIASGGTSTPIMGTLHLSANGGGVWNFRTPINTASGSALVYKQSTAISPLSITVQGFVD